MLKQKKLKSCPFCACPHVAVHYGATEWWVVCLEETCHASGPRASGKETALGLWNNRALGQEVSRQEVNHDCL